MTNAIATLAILSIDNIAVVTSENVSTVRFDFGGRRYELTRYQGGRVELYEEYADVRGLFNFVGYLDAVESHLPALHSRAIAEAVQVLGAAHDDHWRAFLPGADRWLHSKAA